MSPHATSSRNKGDEHILGPQRGSPNALPSPMNRREVQVSIPEHRTGMHDDREGDDLSERIEEHETTIEHVAGRRVLPKRG